MRDPVALAWSGRIPEARAAALAQAASDDPFLAAQGLEALAVLGREHGVRADAAIDALLGARAEEGPPVARKAFDAAMGLESRVVEPVAAALLASGRARWDVLRYAGEMPSLTLARALAAGWEELPRELRDEALLTSCAMPAATADEALAWGRRALAATADPGATVRAAAFTALRCWGFAPASAACVRGLDDDSPLVRSAAAAALAMIDPDQLLASAQALGEGAVEARAALTDAQRAKLVKPKKR